MQLEHAKKQRQFIFLGPVGYAARTTARALADQLAIERKATLIDVQGTVDINLNNQARANAVAAQLESVGPNEPLVLLLDLDRLDPDTFVVVWPHHEALRTTLVVCASSEAMLLEAGLILPHADRYLFGPTQDVGLAGAAMIHQTPAWRSPEPDPLLAPRLAGAAILAYGLTRRCIPRLHDLRDLLLNPAALDAVFEGAATATAPRGASIWPADFLDFYPQTWVHLDQREREAAIAQLAHTLGTLRGAALYLDGVEWMLLTDFFQAAHSGKPNPTVRAMPSTPATETTATGKS